jgi:hypothetical protein
MPAQTPCIHCKTVGFVRREHVITGGKAVVEYYCGHCEHAWVVADNSRGNVERRPKRKLHAKPDRSRS